MKKEMWGLVGIGKLGQALLKQVEDHGVSIGIYHPDQGKIAAVQQKYPLTKGLTLDQLANLDFLILALPAHQIRPFINTVSQQVQLDKVILINMATSQLTATLRQEYPDLKWMGMKFMGHSEDLFLYGNGLFVTEEMVNRPDQSQRVISFFSQLGKVVIDKEDILEQVNRVATYHAIRAAIELEKDLRAAGLSAEYGNRAVAAIAPQVMRSYSLGTLGHFGQKIAQEIEEEG